MPIPLRTRAEMDKIAAAGGVLDAVLSLVVAACRVGPTTLDLSRVVDRAMSDARAEPILAMIPGKAGTYGHSCCICVNEEVVHAPPRGRIIRPGDVVTIDAALRFPPDESGWCVDASHSLAIPGGDEVRARALVEAAESCVAAVLERARPGERWSDLARIARDAAAARGFCLAPGYSGHGIGRALHEPPSVGFEVSGVADFVLRPGMVFTIEPIVIEGKQPPDLVTLDDGWTVLAADRRRSAHREVTVGIVRAGPIILAGRPSDGMANRVAQASGL